MNEILKEKSESAIGAALEANLIEQVRLYATSPLGNFYEENNMVRSITGFPISI